MPVIIVPVGAKVGTVTGVVAVAASPAGLVTVRVKVVVMARAPVRTPGLPLTMAPTPWSTVPTPFSKEAMSVADVPAGVRAGVAVKAVIRAAGTTSTVAWAVRESPAALVTVRV